MERRRLSTPVVKEMVCIELLMSLEPVQAAVKVASARLGDDVYECASIAAVFGLIIVEQHLHFRDRVHAGGAVEAVNEIGIASGLPVQRERVHAIPGAAYVRRRSAERV